MSNENSPDTILGSVERTAVPERMVINGTGEMTVRAEDRVYSTNNDIKSHANVLPATVYVNDVPTTHERTVAGEAYSDDEKPSSIKQDHTNEGRNTMLELTDEINERQDQPNGMDNQQNVYIAQLPPIEHSSEKKKKKKKKKKRMHLESMDAAEGEPSSKTVELEPDLPETRDQWDTRVRTYEPMDTFT